jgi:hypothetical protein
MGTLRFFAILAGVAAASSAIAAAPAPAIAVTDLAYTHEVSQYFSVSDGKASSTVSSNQNGIVVTQQSQNTSASGNYKYIEQRELGSFVNDIKGALLKGTTFRLVQGKTFDAGDPQNTKAEQVLDQMKSGKMTPPARMPEVKDIIARIRKGEFPGADYVLFGTLSNIQFVDQNSPLQGTTSVSYTYGIDLVADFSLIDTKTYEIKGSFSAEGTGKEMKLLSNRGDSFTPNRSKVMRQTSQSLAADVFAQLSEQLQIANPDMGNRVRTNVEKPAAPAPGAAPAQKKQDVIILR